MKRFVVQDDSALDAMIERVGRHDRFAFDYEYKPYRGNGRNSPLIGTSFAIREGNEYISYYVPVAHEVADPTFVNYPSAPRFWRKIKPLLKAKKRRKLIWSFTENIYSKLNGIDLGETCHDVQMKAFLADENLLYPYRLKDCTRLILGRSRETLKTVAGDERDLSRVPIGLGAVYATDDSIDTYMLDEWLTPVLEDEGLMDDFLKVEVPIGAVLRDLVINGIGIDLDECKRQSALIHQQQSSIEQQIYAKVGHPFNLNSRPQLGHVLFNELKLRLYDANGHTIPLKMTSGGKKGVPSYATDDEVMKAFADAGYEVPILYRDYGDFEKFRGTYVDKFPQYTDENRRYHPSFKQWGTKTGRYSSDFQQAPRPDKEKHLLCSLEGCSEPHYDAGKIIQMRQLKKGVWVPLPHHHQISVRRLVVPAEGNVLIDGDYNQLELRLLAHFSEDPALMWAYQNGVDLHQETADACGCSRSDAKAVNFGLAYGLTLNSLIEMFGEEKGRRLYPILRGRYKVLTRFIAAVIEAARRDGFVRTLAGRKRRIPEINDGSWVVRSHAERQAFNAVIQGSAADIVKLAQRNIARTYPELIHILQVHDEIIYEAEKRRAKELARGIKEICEGVVTLRVPLLCEPKIAMHWRDAK